MLDETTMTSLIITTDLNLLVRQDYHDAEIGQVQEVYRDPHGNIVRFTISLHAETKNQGSDFALAENFIEGRWHPLIKMFPRNLPTETGAAMTWLMASTGAILQWPGAIQEAA
jgi:hypothetical protein